MSLVKIVFEAVALSFNGVMQQSNLPIISELQLEDTLFNKTKETESGYVFHIYAGWDDLSPEDMESYDLMEAWCLFIHQSVHKTRLAVAFEVACIIYGINKPVVKSILGGLGYN